MHKRNQVLWIISAVLFLLIVVMCWVLLTPIIIVCDTTSGRYEVRQRGTFSFVLLQDKGPVTQFRVMGVRVSSNLYQRPKKRAKKRKRKARSRSVGQMILLIKRASKALILRDLAMDIDTGDVVLNARLVPVACFLTSVGRSWRISINFEGRVQAFLKAELRLNILFMAVMKYLLKR